MQRPASGGGSLLHVSHLQLRLALRAVGPHVERGVGKVDRIFVDACRPRRVHMSPHMLEFETRVRVTADAKAQGPARWTYVFRDERGPAS